MAHPVLARVATRALELSEVDFTVFEVERSLTRQANYVKRGVSKTMDSKHLRQKDGWAHAVDLVPYVSGRPRWEWQPIFKVAEAMQQAAREQEAPIRWGGGWCDLVQDATPEEMFNAYVERKRVQGKTPFADGPHFELMVEKLK